MKCHKKQILFSLMLIILSFCFEKTGQAEDGPNIAPDLQQPIDWSKKHGVIEVGPIVYLNTDMPGASIEIREALIRHLRLHDGVIIPPANQSLYAIRQAAKRNSLSSFVITGSVKSVTRYQVPNQIVFEATASFVVMDHPGRGMRSVITQSATISRSLSEYREGDETHLKATVIDQSMRLVAESLANLLETI